MRRLLLVPLLPAAACASPPPGPAAVVSQDEAGAAVQRLVERVDGEVGALRACTDTAEWLSEVTGT